MDHPVKRDTTCDAMPDRTLVQTTIYGIMARRGRILTAATCAPGVSVAPGGANAEVILIDTALRIR